jgi:hypothetical protein
METVGDLIKRLAHYDPAEPIVIIYWTKSDVQDEVDNNGGSLKVPNALAETILSKFSIGDYSWNSLNEDFSDAMGGELDEFRCEECYGYYDTQDLASIEGTKTCNECGEEPDAPLYSTSNEAGRPSAE